MEPPQRHSLEKAQLPTAFGAPTVAEVKSGFSAWQVGFSVANLILGNALFALPYAFVKCGWCSVILVVLSVGVMLYTAILLGDVLAAIEKRVCVQELDYGAIGELALGHAFRPVFALFSVGECFAMIVFFLVFTSSSLGHTFNLSHTHMVWLGASVASVFSVIPKRYMTGVSVFGIFLVFGAVIAVAYSGLVLPPGRRDHSQSMFGSDGFFGMPGVMSTVAMAVADHPVFARLYCASDSRESFTKGLALGYSAFLVIALLLGVVAYATFGVSTHPVVLTNIGEDAQGMKVSGIPVALTVACNVALSIRCIQVLPAFLKPITQQVQYLGMQLQGADAGFGKMRKETELIVTIAILYACAFAAARLSDVLFEMATVIGALFKSINVFVVPCGGYLALCKGRLEGKTCKRLLISSLLVIGVIYGVIGTAVGLLSHGLFGGLWHSHSQSSIVIWTEDLKH